MVAVPCGEVELSMRGCKEHHVCTLGSGLYLASTKYQALHPGFQAAPSSHTLWMRVKSGGERIG